MIAEIGKRSIWIKGVIFLPPSVRHVFDAQDGEVGPKLLAIMEIVVCVGVLIAFYENDGAFGNVFQ